MGRSRKRSGILGAWLSLGAILAVLVPATALAEGGDWPQFHGDPANTGYSAAEAPDDNTLAWQSADIGAVAASSPAVAGGKVFVKCADALTCLNKASGAVVWSEPITPSSVWGDWSSPAYSNGRVFVSGGDVYCFSEDGGPALWTFPLASDGCDGSPTVADGKVVVSDWDGGHYYFLDETSGTLLWTFTVAGTAQGSAAYDGEHFYLTSWEYGGGHVYCVDAETKTEVWHVDGIADEIFDFDTCGSPCVAEGKVFVTTYAFYGYGELVALNTSDGSLAWGPVSIERTDATPAYADGWVYVSGGCVGYSDEGERTYCFNAASGGLVWKTKVKAEPGALNVGNWTCSPAVADSKVFVGKAVASDDGSFDYQAIYALDIASGNEVWHYDHGGASPAVAGGWVFTIGEGRVWAFGSQSLPSWDVNQDGSVDILDIARVGLHWGESGEAGWIREDVNSDGEVDILDIAVIGLHWGE